MYHLHGTYGLHQGLFACFARRPFVATTMGYDLFFDEQMPKNLCFERAQQYVLDQARAITVKSAVMWSRLQELGVPESKILRVDWGVDTAEFCPLSSQAAPSGVNRAAEYTRPLILSVRGMAPIYNIHSIIQAFAPLARRAELVVVDGDPGCPYRRRCVDLARKLGIQRWVRFIPFCPQSEMPALYGSVDLVVSAALSDGLPQSAYEAMACKKPLILGELPHFRGEFDHAQNCYMVANTVDALSEGMRVLLADEGLRARLGENGRAFVLANRSLSTSLERIIACYETTQQAPVKRASFSNRVQLLTLLLLGPYEHILRGMMAWMRKKCRALVTRTEKSK